MAECENCVHQYVCEKRTCAECVGIYCDECEIYCQYDGKPDIENCKDFINENDVVPVVRCSQCKHCRKDVYFDYCDKYSRAFDKLYVEKDHFCSYGERENQNE